MNYLSVIESTEGRGQKIGVFLKTSGVPTMMECVWIDCGSRYLIPSV